MATRKKVTWRMIFIDFKQHYPRLGKQVTHWQPSGYSQIDVVLKDGMKLVYNYDDHKAIIVRLGWK